MNCINKKISKIQNQTISLFMIRYLLQILSFICFASCSYSDEYTVLIPNNYIGFVYIYMDCPKGYELKDDRLIKVDSVGKVFIKNSIKKKNIKFQYYDLNNNTLYQADNKLLPISSGISGKSLYCDCGKINISYLLFFFGKKENYDNMLIIDMIMAFERDKVSCEFYCVN